MKKHMRYAAWCLAVCLSLTALFSCKKQEWEDEITDTVTSTVPITDVQTTETANLTETEAETNIVTETETESPFFCSPSDSFPWGDVQPESRYL